MSYITEIFERADLQHIREFLLCGVECSEVTNETYNHRLKSAEKSVLNMLDEKFSNDEERDKIVSDVQHYAEVSEEVYMEIGMQCGALLAAQLLNNKKGN